MSGTIEMKTDRLLLRRHIHEDADVLFEVFGSDPKMYEYSGWNPYQTKKTASDTIGAFINDYDNPRFYGWGIEREGKLIGTIGAYDYDADKSRIEIGMSIERASWGRGFAAEALKAVLRYLTESENIRTVTAWCASGNTGSRKALEKAGMRLIRSEAGALKIGDRMHDKLIFEYAVQQG